MLTPILQSYSSSSQTAQPKRIRAIEFLWKKILLIRKMGYIPNGFYTVVIYANIPEKGSNSIFDDERVKSLLDPLSVDDVKDLMIHRTDVEKYRPFLGEYLWALYSSYDFLIARVILLLIEGRDKRDAITGKINKSNLIYWYQDENTRSVIDVILNDEEKKTIYTTKDNSFKLATDLLEKKIIEHSTKVLSGEIEAYNNSDKESEILKKLIQVRNW